MRKALLSFLCMATCWLCIPTSLKAQSADERIENPINQNNWFELQRQLAVTPQDSVTPFLYLMGKSLTQHHFNQPQKACQTLQTLLQNHQQELGYHNSLNMAVLLSASLARSHQYKQAAELLQSLVQ